MKTKYQSTTWMQRFREALTLLTGVEPPLNYCEMWVAGVQEKCRPLQNWVGMQKGTPYWAQNIVIIDAATVIADSPVEGSVHKQ